LGVVHKCDPHSSHFADSVHTVRLNSQLSGLPLLRSMLDCVEGLCFFTSGCCPAHVWVGRVTMIQGAA